MKNAPTDQEAKVYGAIIRAWTETLPDIAFDPLLQWGETGADSLVTLHLTLRLEKYLGKKVPFDFITPDVTGDSLVRRLVEKAPTPISTPMFLIPAIWGDEPQSASFRRFMSDIISFSTLELPDLDANCKTLADIKGTGAFVASEIARRQPSGDIRLAGFSYGAYVAYEASVKLISSGRNVAFLCLLDPLPSFGVRQITPRAAFSKVQNDFASPERSFLDYVDRLTFYILFALNAFELARLHLLYVKKRSNLRDFVRNRKRLLTRLRGPSLSNWTSSSTSVRTLLATSEDGVRLGSATFWPQLCSDLNIVNLGGSHGDIFNEGALVVLKQAITESLSAGGQP
jgi:thioesterase domain-containing protein